MDDLSLLFPSTPDTNPLLYNRGNAAAWVFRSDKVASVPYYLSGRLYLAKSGWLLLSVPNAFVRGLFDALTAPGAELPTDAIWGINDSTNTLNAHISVMSASEVRQIGADKITERGHNFKYGIGAIRELDPKSDKLSRVWFVEVTAPELSAIRKGYGLSPLPHGDHQFHVTIAVRRKSVLRNNAISKFDVAAGRGALKTAADGGMAQLEEPPGGKAALQHILDSNTQANGVSNGKNQFDQNQIPQEASENNLQAQSEVADMSDKKVTPRARQKQPSILNQLLTAKAHSDARRYSHKHEILRKLMHRAPEDWLVDDPDKYHMGITHLPTRFRFHADPSAIPVGVNVQKAAGASPYMGQLLNLDLQRNVPANASIGQRIFSQFQQAKANGDWQVNAAKNTEGLRAAMSPVYKYQRNMALARGQWPQEDLLTTTIQNHGDAILGAFK